MEVAKRSSRAGKKDNRRKTPVLDSDGNVFENLPLTSEVQHLRKENEERNAELAIISSVQQGLASRLEFQAIIDLVGDQVRAITNAKSISIALYDKTSGIISWPYWLTLDKRIEIPDCPMEQGITRRVMYANKPLNLGTEQEILAHDAIPPQEGWTVGKSFLGVPFTVGDVILGALSLHDFEDEHAFNESDERLLQTLANSMSLALENARLFDETKRRTAELQIINSVQEGLATKLDMQAIYDLVGDKIRGIFHHTDAEIRIYDPRTNLVHFPYITDRGNRIVVDPILLKNTGMSSHVLRTGKTLVINEDLMQEVEKYGTTIVPGGHPAKSAVFVPLSVNNQARGLLVLGNVEREHAFSNSDVRLLQTLANSMSTALENARLFDETQRLLKETEERNAELSIITSVQRALASKLEMQAIYDLVGDKIRDVFDAQGVGISYYDRPTNFIRFPYCLFRGERITEKDFELGKGLTSHIIQSRQPLLINENAAERYKELGAIFAATESEDTAKSWLGVPLIAGGQVTGVIQLENYEREFAYSDSDVRLLTTLANSMSVALENARLFDEVQKKNAEITEALERETASNDILRVIAESPTDIQPVLRVIARNAAQLSGSDDAIITLRDGDMLYVDAHYGDVPTFPAGEGMRFNRDSVAGRAILDGRPLQAIHNQHGVKSEYSEGDKVARKYGYRMTCAVPLMREGKAIGAISIRRIKPELLTGNQIALIQSFANQAAIAVENVRLFNETTRLLKETEERNAELALINSVQSALAAKLNIQGIYDAVGDSLREIFNQSDVGIAIYDDKKNLIHIPYTYESGKRVVVNSFALDEQGFIAHILRTRETLVINEDMAQEMEKYGSHIIDGTVMDKSLVYVPLIVGDQARGVISLNNSQHEHAFNDSDVRLLTTIANSMSVALENARLFDETQRLLKETEQRAAELAIINSIQQGLAAELDFQALVDLVGNKLRQVFGNSDVTIGIYDPKTDLGSVPYIVENGQRFHIEPFKIEGRGFTGELIRNPRTILINQNMAQEMEKFGSRVLPGTSLAKSMLDVPLIVGGVPRGKLQLQDMNKEGAFTDSDVRLLETIANSMSVALENARLFNETQRLLKETEQRAAELAIINSVQAGLASKLDIQAIYDLVGDKIRDLFNAQSVWIQIFDQATRTRQFRYGFYKRRLYIPEALPYNKLIEHLIAIKKPLVINQNADAKKVEFEMVIVEGSEMFKSAVFVPLIAGGEVKGTITLQNMEQENAFSESDINLLSTLASSMSVALENARLFDETQHLLKETEQSNAELAIINSVQAGLAEGLASKRDMQAIYDLIGDKIRELFPNTDTEIRVYDPKTNRFHVPYYIENGQRVAVGPISLSDARISDHVLRTGQTLVINENILQEMEKYGAKMMRGRMVPAKSVVFVPLLVGNQARGLIILSSVEREHAFSQSDVRLFQTLANSMSTALENARLFDETQRLLLEAKEARTAAEQADQSKSAFLSSMSHELRTPLNAIINFVEMVARGMIGPVNQEQVELLDQALHSSKHLLNLINDVLDISKIQAGQLTLFIEEQVSIQIELEATLSIVGGLLQEKGLQLIRDIDPHLPMVSCDRRRMRQVLLNLISNAIKFTNEGTVTVSVKNLGREVLFAVIDTGPGIPLDEQGLIFEPFIQAENGERQVHGTGLGLPISRSLVRAHGGELWVDSNRGEGSAFFFTLPVDGMRTT